MRKIILTAAIALVSSVAQAQYMPGVRVEIAPPAPMVEQQPPRPSGAHTWVEGHWAWRGGRHEWIHGFWSLPPQSGYTWVAARWVNEGGHWVFFEGHWLPPAQPVYVEPAPAAAPVYAEAEPPAPIVENRPMMPAAGYIWIPGYWQWQGRHHVWVGGYWSAPRVGYRWEAHRWERGRDGRWLFVEGGWRR